MISRDRALELMSIGSDARDCDAAEAPVLYCTDAEGNDVEKKLPMRWAVCDVCSGRGTHVNPSIDAHGISAEEFAEDPDFGEAYFSGAYDQTCNRCQGRTTVPDVDWDRLSPEDAAAYQRQCRDEAIDRAAELAERRRGA